MITEVNINRYLKLRLRLRLQTFILDGWTTDVEQCEQIRIYMRPCYNESSITIIIFLLSLGLQRPFLHVSFNQYPIIDTLLLKRRTSPRFKLPRGEQRAMLAVWWILGHPVTYCWLVRVKYNIIYLCIDTSKVGAIAIHVRILDEGWAGVKFICPAQVLGFGENIYLVIKWHLRWNMRAPNSS